MVIQKYIILDNGSYLFFGVHANENNDTSYFILTYSK